MAGALLRLPGWRREREGTPAAQWRQRRTRGRAAAIKKTRAPDRLGASPGRCRVDQSPEDPGGVLVGAHAGEAPGCRSLRGVGGGRCSTATLCVAVATPESVRRRRGRCEAEAATRRVGRSWPRLAARRFAANGWSVPSPGFGGRGRTICPVDRPSAHPPNLADGSGGHRAPGLSLLPGPPVGRGFSEALLCGAPRGPAGVSLNRTRRSYPPCPAWRPSPQSGACFLPPGQSPPAVSQVALGSPSDGPGRASSSGCTADCIGVER